MQLSQRWKGPNQPQAKPGAATSLERFQRSKGSRALRNCTALFVKSSVLNPFVVRVLLFDKTPGANWAVGWHQDPAIAVREQIDTPGFSGWSLKAGVLHVHPPAEILARMLTLRLHLDPCGPENGPLRVIPGSHSLGRLSEAEIQRHASNSEAVSCTSPRGGVLAMRPLLLHASSPATQPNHRRVLHLEFACDELPVPLQWHEELRSAF